MKMIYQMTINSSNQFMKLWLLATFLLLLSCNLAYAVTTQKVIPEGNIPEPAYLRVLPPSGIVDNTIVSVNPGAGEKVPEVSNSESRQVVKGTTKRKRIVFTIGDSTMADKNTSNNNRERGWAQMFPFLVDEEEVQVSNHARDGRSTKSFIDEGRWDAVVNQLQAGDYVFIEFGHNDQKSDQSSLYAPSQTVYKDNLTRFVNETRAKGAFPVLLTSIVRRQFDEQGILQNTLEDYPDVVRALAAAMDVPLIDMYNKTFSLVQTLGPASAGILYVNDITHLNEYGAIRVAQMVAQGIRELDLPLAGSLKEDIWIEETPFSEEYTCRLQNPSFEYEADNKPFNAAAVVRGVPFGWQQRGVVAGNSFGINSKDAMNIEKVGYCWYNVSQPPYAMPEDFELSQTVEDLPAGDYVVRCRLGVASGYETTVRLFANQNVQYYGKKENYQKNQTEGEDSHFACWTPNTGMGNPEMKEMCVKVTIREGEALQLGIRSSNRKSDGMLATGSSSSNVYGGFKVDYFRLEYLSSVTPEAIKEKLNSLIHEARELYLTTEEATESGYYPEESRIVFDAAILRAASCSGDSEPGASDYRIAIEALELALNLYKRSFITVSRQVLLNPGFEYEAEEVPFNGSSVIRGVPYGWQQTGTVLGNSYGINYKDATGFDGKGYCWYNVGLSPYAMPELFELYQIVSGLPAGEYVVKCKLAVMQGYMTNVRLFANENVQYYGTEADYLCNLAEGEYNSFAGWAAAPNMYNPGLKEMFVTVTVREGEWLKLGIRSSNLKSDGTEGRGSDGSNVYGGFKVDDFRIEMKDHVAVQPISEDKPAVRVDKTEDHIQIIVKGKCIHGNAKLYSPSGILLQDCILASGVNSIFISSKGLYLLRIMIDGQEFVEKLRMG